MIDPKYRFRLGSTLSIMINMVIGIGAIFLVERLIPAIDEILQENASSVAATISMQEAILLTNEEAFWRAYANAEANVSIAGEEKIVAAIKEHAESLWAEKPLAKPRLIDAISKLSQLNLEEMARKEEAAGTLGLSGAWALGFLVMLSVLLQLAIRSKVQVELIEPVSELVAVIRDYYDGNSLRRFNNQNAADEIRDGGNLLNKVLDRDMDR